MGYTLVRGSDGGKPSIHLSIDGVDEDGLVHAWEEALPRLREQVYGDVAVDTVATGAHDVPTRHTLVQRDDGQHHVIGCEGCRFDRAEGDQEKKVEAVARWRCGRCDWFAAGMPGGEIPLHSQRCALRGIEGIAARLQADADQEVREQKEKEEAAGRWEAAAAASDESLLEQAVGADTVAAVKRKLAGEQEHQDNPYKTIHLDVEHYWDTDKTLLALLAQFLGGYVWACRHDSNFVAKHEELPAVQALLDRVEGYRRMGTEEHVDPEEFYGTRFAAWCLVELATLQPAMWD